MSNGIPHSSSIIGTSPSGCLVSYPGHSLGGFDPSAEMQSVYSSAPHDWGKKELLVVHSNTWNHFTVCKSMNRVE